MSKKTYMLDTNICSFLIRKKPGYLLDTLQQAVQSGHQVVISAITYAELTFHFLYYIMIFQSNTL